MRIGTNSLFKMSRAGDSRGKLSPARGRAAEYWGESNVASDRWVLSNGIPERAAAWRRASSASFRRNLDAFADGINAYAQANPGKIDPKVAVVLPLSGVDIMAHAHRLMNYIYIAPEEKTIAPIDRIVAGTAVHCPRGAIINSASRDPAEAHLPGNWI